MGSTVAVFSDLPALCSSAALFHWFTESKWPRLALGHLEHNSSQPTSQELTSPSETALRNSGKDAIYAFAFDFPNSAALEILFVVLSVMSKAYCFFALKVD